MKHVENLHYLHNPKDVEKFSQILKFIGMIWKIGRRGCIEWRPCYRGRARWTSAWKNIGAGVLKENVAWRTWHDYEGWRICLDISALGLGL